MDLGQHHDWWTSPCRWQWPFRNKQVTNRHGERESSAEDVVPPPEHGPERRDVHSGPSLGVQEICGAQGAPGHDLSSLRSHVLWGHGGQIESDQNNGPGAHRI
ncbi:hypothetical protein CEXT_97311 [Caerostris extrusa]|uniref:Uncharacterized protein n=1 Tax=Caerostris extrusa TaxID=172846 RepID=A0AAV4NFJ3_CAEEX|nr:hypothetical protein CEXT_97311 [Caerostris extrusa]